MVVECSFNIGNAVVNLAGIAIAGFVGFLSARSISDRSEFSGAAAKLRAAFARSLMNLNLARIDEADPGDIHNHQKRLKDDLTKLAEAIEEFRPFVRNCDRGAYQAAWEDYYKTINEGGVAVVKAYNENDPWSVVEQKIQTILDFAKPGSFSLSTRHAGKNNNSGRAQ